MKSNHSKTGFTLIELLIVVAIIAILAAIAIPNFLQAQVRSKVARIKENMATTATALEAYYVDNNSYPWVYSSAQSGGSTWFVTNNVTTPIAYITSVPDDIFNIKPTLNNVVQNGGLARLSWKITGPYGMDINTGDGNPGTDQIFLKREDNSTGIQYVVFSVGPGASLADSLENSGGLQGTNYGYWYNNGDPTAAGYPIPQPHRYWYDPTNGTISIGYVEREQGGTNSP